MAVHYSRGNPKSNERAAIQTLLSTFSDEYALITSIPRRDRFRDRPARKEIDCVLVGPHGVIVLELKHYSGNVHARHEGQWDGIGDKENPLQQAQDQAQQLKGRLEEGDQTLSKQIYVTSVVVLTHPNCELTCEGPYEQENVGFLSDVVNLVERKLASVNSRRGKNLNAALLTHILKILNITASPEQIDVWRSVEAVAQRAAASRANQPLVPPSTSNPGPTYSSIKYATGSEMSQLRVTAQPEAGYREPIHTSRPLYRPVRSQVPLDQGVSVGKVLAMIAAGVVGFLLLARLVAALFMAIHGSSNISFASAAVARRVENGQPVDATTLFDGAPAEVVFVANYVNGRAGEDVIRISIWNSGGGQAARCSDLAISGANGWISCPATLGEGSYYYQLAVNDKILGNYPFRIVDRNRLNVMIEAAAISSQVRNERPVDTRAFDAGSPVGIYLTYQNARNDTISLQLTKDGVVTSTCKDYVLGYGSGSYYCDWQQVDPGKRSFVVLIDGIKVGEYAFVVNAPPPPSAIQFPVIYSMGIQAHDTAAETGTPPRAPGVTVSDVMTNSPATDAGIERGDVIADVFGRTVSSATELEQLVASVAPGSIIDMSIFRGGNTLTLRIAVGMRPWSKADTSSSRNQYCGGSPSWIFDLLCQDQALADLNTSVLRLESIFSMAGGDVDQKRWQDNVLRNCQSASVPSQCIRSALEARSQSLQIMIPEALASNRFALSRDQARERWQRHDW